MLEVRLPPSGIENFSHLKFKGVKEAAATCSFAVSGF